MSAGFCWLFNQVWKCAGGERCVDLETQKEGKKSTPKGREAEVTSTVRERSHANNARLLCLECQLKTSLASQEHAYRRRFFVILSVGELISIIFELKWVPKAAQFWAPKTVLDFGFPV